MNMERIEELCLNYLRQSDNPLVPVTVLAEYCAREDKDGRLSAEELLPFLRRHGEVRVMEGPSENEAIGAELFSAAGIDMGPRAILKTRIPAPGEIAAMLSAQAEDMLHVLRTALAKAEKEEDHDRAAALGKALERTEAMKARIAATIRPNDNKGPAKK